MPPLYVVHQGAKIRIRNRRLLVEREGKALLHVPLNHVTQVVLFGNVGLTTPAIKTLLGRGLEVVFLTRKGRYRGRLIGEVTPHVPIRRAQYRQLERPEFALDTAMGIVQAKMKHQRALLQRHHRNRKMAEIEVVIDQLHKAIDKVPRKTTLAGLRGLEGSATASYFRGYRRLFDPAWRFKSRNRRPPRDPVNVLLSFGYTLLSQVAVGAVQTAGLDPYLGLYHQYVYNRPGMALDVMEEFRPVVDGVVLWCLRSGQVTPADFTPSDGERPIVLSETGQRRFLQAFETRMSQRFTHPLRRVKLDLRQCVLEQARQVASRLQEGKPGYQGMGFR